MFKFLKDKIKSAVSKITEGVEREGKQEEIEVEKIVEQPKEEKGFFSKLKDRIIGKEETPIKKSEHIKEEKQIPKVEENPIRNDHEKEVQKIKEEKKHQQAEEKTHSEKNKEKPINQKPKHVDIKFEPKQEVKKDIKIEKKIEIGHVDHKKPEIKHSEKPGPKIETKIEVKEKIEVKPKEGHTPKAEPKDEPKRDHKIIIQREKPIEDHKVYRETAKPIEQKQILKEEPKEEKKGFFQSLKEKIITTKINSEQFESLFWEMELALMENNVAVEVIEKIKNDLKEQLVEKPIRRTKVEETILETLKTSIEDLFESSTFNLIEEIKSKKEKPYIIVFLGINGSGKTTSIAKVANMLKQKGFSIVLAASDTFRAASIEQLNIHAEKVGIKMIKHDYGSDPAAVAFDAIKHAKAKDLDVVLIDTAGRMHSNSNLVDELKKITRVAKPDLKIFVGESIAGNDCVNQAQEFNNAVGIDAIILAKADIDEKGGAAISVSYVTKKPILYLGTGQEYKDIEPFDKEKIINNIGLT